MVHDNAAAIDHLARHLGIALSFNRDGVCEIIVDGNASITLEGDPQDLSLRINGVVGHLPDPHEPGALRLLLQANFNGQGTGEASLGLDHVSDAVVLGRAVRMDELGHDGLAPVLEAFANELAHWREHLPRLIRDEGAERRSSPSILRG